jgi:phenylacetate-coenzyme A ligase PaaK-like adenylate-forming protein
MHVTTTTTTTGLDIVRARVGAELAARMPEHLQRLGWDGERLAAHQRDRLRALLRRALAHSPFHKSRLGALDPDRFELADLTRLPTMTKADMMAAFDDLVTDRRVSLRLVENHLATSTSEPRLLLDEYVCLASGGSSGRRGVFVQRLDEFSEFGASIMRPATARRMVAGRPSEPLVIAAVMALSTVHASGFGVATVSGPVQFVSVPATLPISEAVERLNALQPPALMGYPSKLMQLAREQLAGRLAIGPRSVTSTSEQLTADVRATITAAFGVPVVDQFASTEGLVGHSEPGGAVLTFATDMCIVELVDAENKPVTHGGASARILVTNLHNLTQPLIRYELTDRFIRYPALEGSGYLRAEVSGRAEDVFRYGAVDLHPIVIDTVMMKIPSITEYQVHQTHFGVDVDVVVRDPIDLFALAAAIESALRQGGVVNATATVGVVDEIQSHPETGKTRRFVPLR